MSTPEFPAEQPQATPADLASWGTRAAGYLIDLAPIIILNALTFNSRGLSNLVGLIGLAYFIYLGWMDGETGQTPGKAIMGTRVVNVRGELVGGGSGIGRKVAHIVDGIVCGLGWLLPLVDKKRQTIADKIMSTYVVTGMEKRPFAVNLWTKPKG